MVAILATFALGFCTWLAMIAPARWLSFDGGHSVWVFVSQLLLGFAVLVSAFASVNQPSLLASVFKVCGLILIVYSAASLLMIARGYRWRPAEESMLATLGRRYGAILAFSPFIIMLATGSALDLGSVAAGNSLFATVTIDGRRELEVVALGDLLITAGYDAQSNIMQQSFHFYKIGTDKITVSLPRVKPRLLPCD